MAELFLAEVQGLGGFQKQVVLKRILPQLANNAQFVRMFLDEARLAATLHHPNIAQVYDIGRDGGSYFFSMEYVEGRDVRDVCRAFIRRGEKIPIEHACTIIANAAAGLHYAHEKNGPDGEPLRVVHRDVSPANVLVTYEGGVKIVDFGVAKARTQQTETRAGTLKGKISYMSPEQCRGEPLDRRSDVFALGILLFELSTGTRLFRGDGEFKVMTRIVNEDAPSPMERREGYPPGLAAIVKRALARERDERFSTAEELQLAIEELARSTGLKLSTVALGQYMRELFRTEIDAEREGAKRRPLPLTDEEREDLGSGDGEVEGDGAALDDDVPAMEVVSAEVGESVSIKVGREAVEPPPAQRKRWLIGGAAALAFATIIAVVTALVVGRKPATPPTPLTTPPGATTPAATAPATPTTTTATPTPTPVEPGADSVKQEKSNAGATTPSSSPERKKKSRHGKKPRGWDPDSPVLPGG